MVFSQCLTVRTVYHLPRISSGTNIMTTVFNNFLTIYFVHGHLVWQFLTQCPTVSTDRTWHFISQYLTVQLISCVAVLEPASNSSTDILTSCVAVQPPIVSTDVFCGSPASSSQATNILCGTSSASVQQYPLTSLGTSTASVRLFNDILCRTSSASVRQYPLTSCVAVLEPASDSIH